jgi:multidrug efflux pump subunit AcrA (membrane-fusion protein)
MTNHFTPKHRMALNAVQRVQVPRVARRFFYICAFLLVLTVLAAAFVPWMQTARGTGSITALNPDDRTQHIMALVAGRVGQWHVREGSFVKQGDPIVEIIDNDRQIIERLRSERDALVQNHEVARIAADTAKLNFTRQQELFESGLSSRREVEEAKIQYKTYLARESQARAEMTQAETRLSRQETQTLTAPRDGTIVRIIAGDMATSVKEGDVVATFIPADVQPAVELFVNGLDIALIEPGRKVRLQFEGWPVVQFSGWPSIAIGTFGGVVEVVDPAASANGLFRILVVPDPQDPLKWPDRRFLRFGAQVKGWVMLETVSLGYELWRQLNDFPPRYPDDMHTSGVAK